MRFQISGALLPAITVKARARFSSDYLRKAASTLDFQTQLNP